MRVTALTRTGVQDDGELLPHTSPASCLMYRCHDTRPSGARLLASEGVIPLSNRRSLMSSISFGDASPRRQRCCTSYPLRLWVPQRMLPSPSINAWKSVHCCLEFHVQTKSGTCLP